LLLLLLWWLLVLILLLGLLETLLLWCLLLVRLPAINVSVQCIIARHFNVHIHPSVDIVLLQTIDEVLHLKR
jgi:hypothetical protein